VSDCWLVAEQDIAVVEGAGFSESQVQLVSDGFEQRATATNGDRIHDNFIFIDETKRRELRDDPALRSPGHNARNPQSGRSLGESRKTGALER
jgi:hypothetical protein